MEWYGEIPKTRGVTIQTTVDSFRGRVRVDVREYVEARPGDPDTRQPTPRGISLPLDRLPRLLDALRAAEADALRDGLLRAEDYDDARPEAQPPPPHEPARPAPARPAAPRPAAPATYAVTAPIAALGAEPGDLLLATDGEIVLMRQLEGSEPALLRRFAAALHPLDAAPACAPGEGAVTTPLRLEP